MKNSNYINRGQYFAFNVWDINSAKAIIDAASIVRKDVIIQTSMKAFSVIDLEEFYFFVKNYSKRKDIKAFLHLDHCRDIKMIETAIRNGWDSVMIDASARSLVDNILLTNEITKVAHSEEVLVEAEVGQIIGTEDDLSVRTAGVAKIEDIKEFIDKTSVDMLAIAMGTAHGLYEGKPDIRYELISKVENYSDIPLVVHGGTGLSDEILLKLLKYKNIKKINISTDVKQAYRRGIIESSERNLLREKGFDPLEVNRIIHDEMCSMAVDKMKLQR